ncbi:MAG: response regulator [Candidatus Eisenbacteria bacterium]
MEKRLLEALFKHSSSPIAFLDREFNLVQVNEAYAEAYARAAVHGAAHGVEKLVGKNHFQIHPDEETRRIFEHVVQTRQPHRAFARPFPHPDRPGLTDYWDWFLTPVLDEAGEVQFLVLSMEDVSQRQIALEQLQKRTRQLQELTLKLIQAEDQERRRLAELLHDDLQQLLVGSMYQLTVLDGRLDNGQAARDMIRQIKVTLEDSIRKTRQLSHDLSSPVLDQSGLVEGLGWLSRYMNQRFGLDVELDAGPESEPCGETLRTFIYRAVREMLLNAAKHSGVKRAEVRLRRRSGRIVVMVVDQGIGFDGRNLHLDSGGGLGLLSIRERAQSMGGRLRIFSRPGEGSCIALVVPDGVIEFDRAVDRNAPCAAQARPKVRRKPSRPRNARPRVMLADDHKVLRDGLASLLAEEADMEVIAEASNGAEAVTLADRLRPDVIIMDVAMPGMDGVAATRAISARHPAIRIIGLSMFEAADMAGTMLRAGADAFLSKAGPSELLLAAIRGESPVSVGLRGERD